MVSGPFSKDRDLCLECVGSHPIAGHQGDRRHVTECGAQPLDKGLTARPGFRFEGQGADCRMMVRRNESDLE